MQGIASNSLLLNIIQPISIVHSTQQCSVLSVQLWWLWVVLCGKLPFPPGDVFWEIIQTCSLLILYDRKRRFRLTDTQKYRHRKRLRAVDEVVDTLVESGVKLRALVSSA